MNRQTFANVRLNRGKLQSAILILSCFLGLILLAQPSTHSQVGGQPHHDTGAAGGGVDSDSKSKQVLFSVGGRPQRVRFMIAAHGQTFDQMQKLLGPEGSASIRKLINDPIQSLPNVPQGKY